MRFKQYIEEVYKANSPDEKRFIDKHKVAEKDYPVDANVHKATTKKDHTKKASYRVGEDEKVYESNEDLTELSKATLARYLHKSGKEEERLKGVNRDNHKDIKSLEKVKGRMNIKSSSGINSAINSKYKSVDYVDNKIRNRNNGAMTAYKKITKEETGENNIQELSRNLLQRYMNKSNKQRDSLSKKIDRNNKKEDNSGNEPLLKTYVKRANGQKVAQHKISDTYFNKS